MDFEIMKFFWQTINLIILVLLTVTIILVPILITRRVKKIEKHLDDLDQKIEAVSSKKD